MPFTSPSPRYLRGVSCPSPVFCVAVGYTIQFDSNKPRGYSTVAVAARWDGTSWSMMAGTNQFAEDRLVGVSCTSSSFCVAVGDQWAQAVPRAVTQQWDGAAWTTMPSSVDPSASFATLSSVSCTSPTFCVAVGYSAFGRSTDTTSERWDGISWSLLPAGTTRVHRVNGVSCVSASECVMVGNTVSQPTPYGLGVDLSRTETLAELWDGSSWTTTPTTGRSAFDELKGVSCTAVMFCTAVGYQTVKSFQTCWCFKSQTLAETYASALGRIPI